jgi:hypothetical protein
LVALVIIATALTLAVQCIAAGMKVVSANRQLLVASAVLESELEKLRAVPGEVVPLMDALELSPPDLDHLPDARCTLTVTRYRVSPLKQVSLKLSWQPPNGPTRVRTLTTLIGMR